MDTKISTMELEIHQEPTPEQAPQQPVISPLNATLDHHQLFEKALLLQQQLNLKIEQLDRSKLDYRKQVTQNKTLKEYVDNLLDTTHRIATK